MGSPVVTLPFDQLAPVPAATREPERTSMLAINRTTLRLWEWGDAEAPPVVFVHGASDHGRMFDGFAPLVADLGYRAVAYDVRGHGDSGPLSSGMMWLVAALDLALLADHLGGGSPVGAIGHSFGGGQATYAAGVWPERFRWVVNLDGLGPPEPETGPDGPDAQREWSIAEAATRSLDSAERLLAEPPRIYASLVEMAERRQRINVRLPAEWTAHLVRHGARAVDGGWQWKADPMFRWGAPGDFDDEYLHAEHALTTVPLLVLTGAETDTWSELSPATIANRLASFPDARHREIAGAGHYVHIEQPDAVLAELDAFLREVGEQ